jgi:predicted nucleic acid-binding protein
LAMPEKTHKWRVLFDLNVVLDVLMRKLLQVFEVAGVDRQVIETACDLGRRDFEDAVQTVAASGAGCHSLVTRDPRDYASAQMTVIQPADFLAVWAGVDPDS